jgi:hypothetical protein
MTNFNGKMMLTGFGFLVLWALFFLLRGYITLVFHIDVDFNFPQDYGFAMAENVLISATWGFLLAFLLKGFGR